MVDNYKDFAIWALGALSAIVIGALMFPISEPGWTFGLIIFGVLLIVAFYRVAGKACEEAILYLEGGIEARRVRRQIDRTEKRESMIVLPGEMK